MAEDVWGKAIDRTLARKSFVNTLDDRNPADVRKANQIGQSIGLPGPTVEADLPGFENEAKLAETQTLLGFAPGVATFGADPHRMSAIKDDIPTMAEISHSFRLAPNTQRAPLSRQLLYTAAPLPRPILSDLPATSISSSEDAQPNEATAGNVARGLGAGIVGGTAEGILGATDAVAENLGLGAAYHSTDWYARNKFHAQQDAQTSNVQYKSLGNVAGIDINPGRWAYGAATSLGQMGLSIMSGQPLTAMGVQAGGQFYEQARNRGASVKEATGAGLSYGGIEAATESVGLGFLLGNFGKKAAGKFVGGLLLREVPQELTATTGENLVDAMTTGGVGWEQYKKNLPQDLVDTAMSTALMIGTLGAGSRVVRGRVAPEIKAQADIGHAIAGAQFLDKLMDNAAKSKARKEDPETLKAFVKQHADNSPVRNVYLPVEAVNEYMQSEAYEPGTLEQFQPQIDEAQSSPDGTVQKRSRDVVIPIEDAAAHLSGTPAWDALKDNARVTPGGYSIAESKVKADELFQDLEKRGAELAKEADAAGVDRKAVDEAFDEIKNVLLATGQVDSKHAEAVARVTAERYAVRGAKYGQTPLEAWKAAKIEVSGMADESQPKGRKMAQSTPATVNIGLDVNDGSKLTTEEAVKALSKAGVSILDSRVHQSDSEQTLVAKLDRALTPKEAHAVSKALRQDAIAQHDGTAGALHGPEAAKWGDFNPEFFLNLDGSRMGQTLDQSALAGGYEGLARFMSDDEKDGLRAASKAKILAIAESLPDAQEMAAVALAGRAKRGWYENSAQAILDVFGAADAPRFAALLAALSPQTSVQSNLYNALKVWTNWNDAGRPTERKAIVEIMGRSVEGTRGVASVLTAWINNSVLALTHPEPAQIKLSGPKVDSFMSNLVGVVDEVTQDTWMASFMGADPLKLRGGKKSAEKGISYKAMNAVVRAAADVLTNKTGELWTPAEVQETIWSFAKTLYEARDKAGQTKTTKALLAAGHVTHDDIANTPDFVVLFANGIYRTILEEGGYGAQTQSLGRNRRAVGVDGSASVATVPEGSGFTQADFEKFLGQAADRLEAVRASRRGEADTRQQELFQDVFHSNGETISEPIGPRVAFHGTPYEFDKFNSSGKAIWFAENRKLAEEYADGRRVRKLTTGRVIEAELNIQRPLNLDEAIHVGKGTVIENPVEWAKEHFDFDLKAHGWEKRGQDYAHQIFRSGAFADAARAAGYDALVVTEGGGQTWGVLKKEAITSGDRTFNQEEVFYSALSRAVSESKQTKATGEQWAATLRKVPGVKQEEMEWTGLLDFLKMTEGPITREQLVDLLAKGGVQIEEVLLGRSEADMLADYGYTVADLEDPEHEANMIVADSALNAQFRNWSSDPSNIDTYRELLITLPPGLAGNPDRAPATHWDTEGVVAHARFMDKTDADGKRVLFIEEVQSDWHQKGRDQGYAQGVSADKIQELELAADKAQNTRDAARDALHALKDRGIETDTPEYDAAYEAWQETGLRYNEARQALTNASQPSGIPNAPFKSSWPALVMKRLIRHAAEQGYDRIAWTTGEEQASRYNLSEATGPIMVSDLVVNGTYSIFTRQRAMDTIVSQGLAVKDTRDILMTEPQMKEAFGAAITERIVEGAKAGKRFTLEAEDLKIGGEGMKAFYDRNLVNITNDIIKKYGAKVQLLPLEVEIRSAHMGRFVKGDVKPSHPGFDITPQMRDAAMQGQPLFQEKRGSVTFTADGQRIIKLFADADFSTLIHELGHVFLEELRSDALRDGATEQDKADWKAAKAWFKANGHTVGDTGSIPTQAHELWARGHERFFMEGKAPSAGLVKVFTQFRAWLLRLYQVVENLRSPITPEIRDVFSRLIATQEAIDEQRNIEGAAPLFATAEDAGMTEAEFADYQARVGEARDEAYNTLLYKTMEAIRRKRMADQREQRGNVRADVAAAINAQPQFRALHLLRTGFWLGDPNRPRQDVKLNTGWLIDTFGEDILSKLPKGLPITRGDGQTGDEIAEMVGASSGQDLVHALVGMRAASEQLRASGEKRSLRDKMIDDQVDKVMADRHGDALTDGTIEEEAIAALNTAAQGDIISAEIRQLSKRTSLPGRVTPYQFVREWAKRKISAGIVRDVISRSALQRYTRGAAKAARLAEKAILEGNIDEAYKQKQAQLLNHAQLAEAKAAADRIDTIVARMQRLGKRAAMKSVDQDYMDRIHALLENYDFRERSQKSIDELIGFQEWAETQRAKGYEVHIPPRLENNGDPYTRVSVEELDALNDVIESLLHLGKTKQKIITARQERDFNEWRDEVVSRIGQLKDRKLPTKPINEKGRRGAGLASEILKVETIVEELDGGPTGPLNDLLVVGATDAENKRGDLRQRILKPIVDMYKGLDKKQWKRLQEKVTLELTWNTLNEGDPRVGQPVVITRMELLSIVMNMGNLSNLEKLSKGERWPVATLHAIMDRELNKQDWDFVQGLWTQVELLWPEIVKSERAMSGVVPEKVVNSPIETKFGTYEGGYWPVVYDASRWQRAEDLEGKMIDDMFGLKSGVATQKGHTIERTQAFGPISFDLEKVLFHHVEQVVTRIAYAPYARDVLRAIRDKRIRGMIDTKLGPEYRKQFEPWLKRQIHEGAVNAKAAAWWQHVLRQFRTNMTIAAMGFRLSTGVAQTLGLTASAQRIGARWVGTGMKRLALNPREATQFVWDRSTEMLHRTEIFSREMAELSQKLRGKHSVVTDLQHWAMWHIGMADRYLVAVPTWLGAHARGMSEGMTDEEASAYGDKAVRQSQGSGREKDLSAWQSPNNEAMRFFTMFYTPFNVMFNAQWQGVRGLKRGDVRPAIAVTFWWMIASTLGDALLSGDWPKDGDDDGKIDWAEWFARNVFFGMWAGVPIARDIAAYEERKVSGQYATFGTPINRVVDAIDRAHKLEQTGEAPTIKTSGDLAAIFTGLPLSQPGATGQFLWDYGHGETDPQSISDWYFGVTKGKVPDENKD